jgi:hypothetical protein
VLLWCSCEPAGVQGFGEACDMYRERGCLALSMGCAVLNTQGS